MVKAPITAGAGQVRVDHARNRDGQDDHRAEAPVKMRVRMVIENVEAVE